MARGCAKQSQKAPLKPLNTASQAARPGFPFAKPSVFIIIFVFFFFHSFNLDVEYNRATN